MTKTDIGIYRGLKEKFDPEVHVGFFITTDTGELLLGDQSLGQTISGWEINDGVLILKLNTGKDIRVTFPEATETAKGLLSAADKAQLNALQANLDSKVDKVTGKSLLADSEIEKLAGLPNSTELTNSIATAKAAGDNAQSDLNAHKQNKSNPHEVTKAQVGLGNVTNDAQVKRSEMGVANGVATLDADGKVPASQLPSYVDDIIDVYATYSKSDTGVLSNVTLYLDAAHTQLVTGEAGKIYQNIADGEPQYQFRWTGTIFSQTGASSLILGEVTGTAYDGAKGKANADNIAKIKGTSLSHIKDAAPVTTAADKVSINYECYEGNQYGAAGTDHTADIPAATTAKAGVMSAADKTKLEDLNSKLVVADEEDVTAVEGKIKFKDRDTTNGMGYKILRLPENGILTQDMINESNTIYEIRYNFDLNGATITIPENCTLKFEGGKLSNGTINGENLDILGQGIDKNVLLTGTTKGNRVNLSWWIFNIEQSITEYFQAALTSSIRTNSSLFVENGVYLFTIANDSPRYCLYAESDLSIVGSGPQTIFKTVKQNLSIPDGNDKETYGTWLYCLAKSQDVRVDLRDFIIDGGNKNPHTINENYNHKAINLQQENYSGHWIKEFYAENIKVLNFEGEGFYNAGYVNADTNYIIKNCQFENNGGSSGNIGSSAIYKDCTFHNANIEHCISANNSNTGTLIVDNCSFYNENKISLSCDKQNMSTGFQDNTNCNCIITNCYFELGGLVDSDRGLSITLKELDKVIITNNTFINGGRAVSYGGCCINIIKYVHDITIDNNVFTANYPYNNAVLISKDSYYTASYNNNTAIGDLDTLTFNSICSTYKYTDKTPKAGSTSVLHQNENSYLASIEIVNTLDQEKALTLSFGNYIGVNVTVPASSKYYLRDIVSNKELSYYISSNNGLQVNIIAEKIKTYSGKTDVRPTTQLYRGFAYYDITLSRYIFWDGTKWIDPAEDSIKWRTIE